VTLLFLADVIHQTFRVHLGQAETLEHIGWSLGLYLVATGVFCVGAYRYFQKPPAVAGGTSTTPG
jgi:hypothetical protein